MASFIRSLLQVALGFALGFIVATYYLPDARKPGTAAPAGPRLAVAPANPAAPAVAPSPAPAGGGEDTPFGHRGPAQPVSGLGTLGQPRTEAPRETPPPVVAVEPPAVAKETPPPAPAQPEAPVDFRELCVKPAAWPPIITLNKDITAQVMQGEEVIAEIPMSAGERLQVSKVFGDATAEVRAKGAKFIVKADDTDLAALARGRLAEISGKVRIALPTSPSPAPAAEPSAPAKPSTPPPAQPRGDDLDSKMRSLFGTPQKH